MEAVLTVVVGALLAGLFTFAGSIYGSKREHAQWLRNARMRAYSDMSRVSQEAVFERVFSGPNSENSSPTDWRPKLEILAHKLAAARSDVMVVGPVSMGDLALELMGSTTDFLMQTAMDTEPVSDAQGRFAAEAVTTLRAAK